MARSIKKGLYIDENIIKKVKAQQGGAKSPIKIWARASMIAPDFVGFTFEVHNGRSFTQVYVTESMVGHRFGEFSPTRTFRTHGKMTDKSTSKT